MLKKIVWGLVAVVVLLVLAFLYLVVKKPSAAAPSAERIAVTAERLARGRYLYENVADCGGCHGDRDFARFGGPVRDGRVGVGMTFPEALGMPGTVTAPNLTPDKETGIGQWSDGEKLRALREGVSRDGHALFGFMPYTALRSLSDEDARSLVVYINSLAPVKNRLKPTELKFPLDLLIKLGPEPLDGPVAEPQRADRVSYGRYLATIGNCVICHTRQERGSPVKGMEYAGGETFLFPGREVRTSNITPDTETGIGGWTEQQFVARFKGYANMTYENAPRATQANFTLMPWLSLSQMNEDDLKAIYAYLRTVKAVRNPVEVHPARASNVPQPESK